MKKMIKILHKKTVVAVLVAVFIMCVTGTVALAAWFTSRVGSADLAIEPITISGRLVAAIEPASLEITEDVDGGGIINISSAAVPVPMAASANIDAEVIQSGAAADGADGTADDAGDNDATDNENGVKDGDGDIDADDNILTGNSDTDTLGASGDTGAAGYTAPYVEIGGSFDTEGEANTADDADNNGGVDDASEDKDEIDINGGVNDSTDDAGTEDSAVNDNNTEGNTNAGNENAGDNSGVGDGVIVENDME